MLLFIRALKVTVRCAVSFSGINYVSVSLIAALFLIAEHFCTINSNFSDKILTY